MRVDLTPVARQTAALALHQARSRSVLGLMTGLLLALTTLPAFAENLPESPASLSQTLNLISSDRMLEDIRTLSGPAYSGRQTGAPDDRAPTEVVRQRFLDRHRQPTSPQETLGLA